ncbi:MAG: PD-(D/E)XK nuclease family protein, partial [Acidimicrobiia bacterium]|nr:PD-(D/E)XK nuclease family protein [Acidimicrobiia bacterium]
EDEEHLPQHTLVEALEHLDEIDLSDDARAAIDSFVERHRRLLTVAQGASLVELVQRILDETDAWRDVQAMAATAQLSARLNLYRFLDLAESWSPLEGRPSLPAFLSYLELMNTEDIEELDTARISDDDAVTLLTVHRAKGLEWDAVFIPAVYHNNFPSSVRLYEDPYTQPAILPYELRLDHHDRPAITAGMAKKDRDALLKARHVDQEWRLAYVAITRARRFLYLSGAIWTGSPTPNKTPAKPSVLLTEVAALDAACRLVWTEDPGDRPEHLRYEGMEASPDPLFEHGWDAALRAIVDDPVAATERAHQLGIEAAYHAKVSEFQEMLFSLPEPAIDEPEPEPLRTSVTGLVTYVTCPKRYYWSEVDRLPRRASQAARRGVELHRRIEMHHRGNVPFDDLDPDLYDVAPAESEGTEETGSAFTRFRESRFAAAKPSFIESPFDLRVSEAARVRGRIDAVYEHSTEHWEIVDFKSGRPSRNPASVVQLQAYALAALDAGFSPRIPKRLDVTFAYFGGGLVEHTDTVTDGWLTEARHHLERIVGSIREERFAPAPSAACTSCDFLKFCPEGQAWTEIHE